MRDNVTQARVRRTISVRAVVAGRIASRNDDARVSPALPTPIFESRRRDACMRACERTYVRECTYVRQTIARGRQAVVIAVASVIVLFHPHFHLLCVSHREKETEAETDTEREKERRKEENEQDSRYICIRLREERG